MAKQALTDLTVKRVKPGPERFDLWDTTVSGLGLRVFPSGKKSFFLSYRIDGVRRRDTLGKFPDLSLADARARAMLMRGQLACGDDPKQEDEPRALTFGDLLPLFITLHCEQKNKPSTIRATKALLTNECLPTWRNRPVTAITRRDVNTVLDRMVARGSKGAAVNCRAAMSKFFRWCAARDYVPVSPVDGVEPPGKVTKRDRVLDDREIVAVWQAAEAMGYPYGTIVQFLLLTAQRRGEVAQMGWDQIDLDAAMWVIPGEFTKNGEVQELPLSPTMLRLLREVPRCHDRYVFPARGNPDRVFSGFGKCKASIDAQIGIPHWTLHDLRRTATTKLAELGVLPHVAERVLNHTSGTFAGVAGIYNRYKYLDAVRAALTAWDKHVQVLVAEELSRP